MTWCVRVTTRHGAVLDFPNYGEGEEILAHLIRHELITRHPDLQVELLRDGEPYSPVNHYFYSPATDPWDGTS